MEKFISLSEVGNHSKLTETEVVRSAGLAEFEWACFIGKTKSILGVFFDEGFRGLGTYNYRGWVGVPAEHAVTIVDEKKVRLRFGRAIDITGAELLSAPIPYTVSFPNELYREWGYPRELTEHPVIHIFPFFEQVLSETHDWVKGLDMIQNMLEKNAPAGFETEPFVCDSLRKKAEQTPEYVLKEHPFEFEYKDLGISLASLKKLEAQMFGTPEVEALNPVEQVQPIEPKHANTLTFNNDLHEVLYNILIAGGDTSHKGVWRTLENEFTKDEGERQFDKYNILLDVSATELLWVSRAGLNRQTMKFSSLATALSKLKKRIISN
ncbi:hypothetical protein AHAT_41910 [Agarivorans sp. Toyoura001]|uniref:hypothetical protein n=1 Tax=Agarivorans sp. Toyoura001 TaxID=2283141 RepID=UPI0010D61A1C|nr:hypothetical protein [Agarivorans sp. Toyoura001]GDY28301.1 hypothetical protein AHAT_41910 [Agarivorans sp. Toyoura001]